MPKPKIIKIIKPRVIKLYGLHQYPDTPTGKMLRAASPKTGVEFEAILLHYLDYIAGKLTKSRKK